MYQPSTPPPVTPHSGRTALIYGVSVGLSLGIIESAVIVYLVHNTYDNSYGQLSLPFSILLWVVLFLVAGALGARRTGKISTGMLTGLWAGIVGGIVTTVAFFATLMSSFSTYGYVGMMATYLTLMIILILLALGMGTGLGALGGLIGQSFATSTRVVFHPYQQSDPPQPHQASDRQSDPPQQERVQYQQSNPSQQELVQYQQSNPSQREQQG